MDTLDIVQPCKRVAVAMPAGNRIWCQLHASLVWKYPQLEHTTCQFKSCNSRFKNDWNQFMLNGWACHIVSIAEFLTPNIQRLQLWKRCGCFSSLTHIYQQMHRKSPDEAGAPNQSNSESYLIITYHHCIMAKHFPPRCWWQFLQKRSPCFHRPWSKSLGIMDNWPEVASHSCFDKHSRHRIHRRDAEGQFAWTRHSIKCSSILLTNLRSPNPTKQISSYYELALHRKAVYNAIIYLLLLIILIII